MLARDSLGRAELGVARPPGGAAAAVGLCTLVGAAVRLVSLRALPVFGDEAIFLRLAELARRDPLARLWIALQEAHAPMHIWLVTLVLPLSSDPVRAGRLLSVVAGVLCVPAAAWVASRIAEAFGHGEDSRVEVLTAAALTAACPFFVLAQRIARVDALFLLETLAAAGLSLSLAIAVRRSSARASLLRMGLVYGILMGVTMLTRQAVSLPLWFLAPGAWVLLRAGEPSSPGEGKRLFAALGLALLVAGLLWMPMLVAPGTPDTITRIFQSKVYRPAMSVSSRFGLAISNIGLAGEAFRVYLTLPVLLFGALGVLDLLAARRWRLLAFLLFWEASLLLPACAFAIGYFPRFALPAAMPVVIVSAHGVSRLWALIRGSARAPAARVALAVLLGGLLLGPAVGDLRRGLRDWRDWRLLPIDQAQFLSGSSAGFASEQAAGWFRGKAAKQPVAVTVLTPEISGNPTDAVWLLLDGEPGIRLSYALDALRQPLLPPAGPDGTRRLPGDSRDPGRREVVVPARGAVFAVVTDPLLTRSGWVPAAAFLSGLNPGLTEAARFENPAKPGSPASSVVVLALRNAP